MVPNEIHIAIIGAGLIGPRHASHVSKDMDCKVFAIVDRSSKGPKVAQSFDLLHFNTVDEMINYCETGNVDYPDAAIVATPNDSHFEIGYKLASRGIHLLIEKPMCSTTDDCMALTKICDQHNVKLLIGHHRRFNPYVVAMKSLLHRVGTPIAVQGTWALKKHDAYFAEKAWRRSVHNGGGALLINLVHDIDILQFLLGPIELVYAEPLMRQRHPEGPTDHVDEGAVLSMRFVSGCCGTFVCADNVVSPFNFEAATGENPLIPHNEAVAGTYRIFGDRGTLSFPDLTLFNQDFLAPENRSWWQPIQSIFHTVREFFTNSRKHYAGNMLTPPGSMDNESNVLTLMGQKHMSLPEPFESQLKHFVNLVRGYESEPRCSGSDAIQTLLCLEAVVRSIETGLPQPIEQLQPTRPSDPNCGMR